jgi:type IV secretion system protein VirB9
VRALLLFVAGLAFAAAPLSAQVRPKPGTGDPRIQSVDFAADQVVLIQGAPGYSVTVELSPDEQVENVAVGDSSAWQVTANHRGDHLFVKAITGGVSTNMTVVTSVRLYNFQLEPLSGGTGDMAYTIRFRYPDARAGSSDDAPSASGEGRYRLGGDRALRPSEISDDGRHTYIRWTRDQALPAVYALGDGGKETLVNGMMRDDVFVIDSVSQKLVFRIDKAVATATRVRINK